MPFYLMSEIIHPRGKQYHLTKSVNNFDIKQKMA